MKFDVCGDRLQEKAQKLDGLMRVLQNLEDISDSISEQPERRATLPYEGQRQIRSNQWRMSSIRK